MELLPLKISSQEVRYFVEEYNNMETLEASLDNSPGDVALWIKLARLQLHQNNDDITSDDADSYQDNVSQALSTLSRGLEENTHSEVCASHLYAVVYSFILLLFSTLQFIYTLILSIL